MKRDGWSLLLTQWVFCALNDSVPPSNINKSLDISSEMSLQYFNPSL